MPRADQLLYSALLRVGRAFEAERLPLLGVAGGGPVCHSLAWRRCLRAALEAPRPDDGLAGELRHMAGNGPVRESGSLAGHTCAERQV